MKIIFDDKSYIEITKTTSDKIIITIVARDHLQPLATIANSVELTLEQFNQLIQLL
jgi:hypothetical protein